MRTRLKLALGYNVFKTDRLTDRQTGAEKPVMRPTIGRPRDNSKLRVKSRCR